MDTRKAKRKNSRRQGVVSALVRAAEPILRHGDRMTIPSDLFEDADHIQCFLTKLSLNLGENVRASSFHGLLVVYPDGADSDGLGVVVSVKL